MVLPLDQGLEHGPTDFFPNPAALDTDFQFRLAVEGHYSAIALGIGLAEKYMGDVRRPRPAHPEAQRQDEHPRRRRGGVAAFASVEDAVRLGADAVGYTRLRRLAAPGRGDPRVREGATGLRALRHAARGVGLPARPRDRGQGRQGHALRAGLRGPRRRGARRRRREAARATEDNERVPRAVPLAARGRRPSACAAWCARRAGAGAVLGRREAGRRRGVLRKVQALHGVRGHRRDVRPQHVAAADSTRRSA